MGEGGMCPQVDQILTLTYLSVIHPFFHVTVQINIVFIVLSFVSQICHRFPFSSASESPVLWGTEKEAHLYFRAAPQHGEPPVSCPALKGETLALGCWEGISSSWCMTYSTVCRKICGCRRRAEELEDTS